MLSYPDIDPVAFALGPLKIHWYVDGVVVVDGRVDTDPVLAEVDPDHLVGDQCLVERFEVAEERAALQASQRAAKNKRKKTNGKKDA